MKNINIKDNKSNDNLNVSLIMFFGFIAIGIIGYKILYLNVSNVASNVKLQQSSTENEINNEDEIADPPFDLQPATQLDIYKKEDQENNNNTASNIRQSAVGTTTSVFDCDDYIDAMKTALTDTDTEIKTVLEVNESGTNTCSIFALYENTTDGYKLMSHEFTFDPSTSGYTISSKTTGNSVLYGHYSTSKSLILISVRSTATITDTNTALYSYVQFWAVPNGKVVNDYLTTGLYNLDSFFSSGDIVDTTNHIYKIYKTNKYLLIPIPANFHIVVKPTLNNIYIDTLDYYNIPTSNTAFPIISFKNSLRRVDSASDYSTPPFKYSCNYMILTPLSGQKIKLTGVKVYAWNGAEATISLAYYGTTSSNTLDLTKLKNNTLSYTSATAGTVVRINLSTLTKLGRVVLYGVGTTMDGGKIELFKATSTGGSSSVSSYVNQASGDDRIIDFSQERLLRVSAGNLAWVNSYYKASPFLEPFVINDFDKMMNTSRF